MPSLQNLQLRSRNQVGRLPTPLLALERGWTYPVEISSMLQAEFDRLAMARQE